jgi:MFS superfamily sulfate permease-like transporter
MISRVKKLTKSNKNRSSESFRKMNFKILNIFQNHDVSSLIVLIFTFTILYFIGKLVINTVSCLWGIIIVILMIYTIITPIEDNIIIPKLQEYIKKFTTNFKFYEF